MNLRSKFLLIIVGFLLLQGIIFYAFFALSAVPKIEQLEEAQAEKAAQRTTNLFKMELKEVEQLTEIWSKQKPFAYFFQSNQLYKIELFYTKERLLEEDLHIFMVIDTEFNLLSETAVDPISRTPMTILGFIEDLTQASAHYFHDTINKQKLSGILMSGRGPVLVSVKPILTQQQDKLGWIIMGRLINSQMLNELNLTMRTDTSVFPIGSRVLPEKIAHLIPVINANPNHIHMEASESKLNTYTYLTDLRGKPSVVLYNAYPKDASLLLASNTKLSYAILLAANFILVLLLLKIINHAFVNPTRRISDFILDVSRNIESPPRIKSKEEDELGLLKHRLNDLIVTFCKHKDKSIHKAYQEGSNNVRYEIIEELSSINNQLIPIISTLETRLWSMTITPLEQLAAEVKCTKQEDMDWEYLKSSLNINTDYLNHELNANRNQVRQIKQYCMRTASILKGYSIDFRHNKPIIATYHPPKRAQER